MSSRVTLLTGGASGIGRALCSRLLRDGHRVVPTDVNLDGLREAAREEAWPEDRVLPLALDVRDPEAWRAGLDDAIAHFGHVDVACNVAGYLHPAWLHEASIEDIHRHVDVNIKGVMFGTRCAAQYMRERGSGHIINVASLAGVAPTPGLGLYSATKFAVRGLSLAAAHELREHGVAVTVVCPDAVETPMLDKQVHYEEAAWTFSGTPLTTTEVVDVIAGRVLKKRPVEVMLPPTRGRLAHLSSLAPGLVPMLEPLVRKKGRREQESRKDDDD
jgi:3-oxoacyl-[acyl-carrier protein] reductase